jgi:hypothetical protein
VAWTGIGNVRETIREALVQEEKARAHQERLKHNAWLQLERSRRVETQTVPVVYMHNGEQVFETREGGRMAKLLVSSYTCYVYKVVQDQQRLIITYNSGYENVGPWYDVGPRRREFVNSVDKEDCHIEPHLLNGATGRKAPVQGWIGVWRGCMYVRVGVGCVHRPPCSQVTTRRWACDRLIIASGS